MQPTEITILVHGLWMRGLVMLPQQRRLKEYGIDTVRFSYPSWSQDLESNAKRLADFAAGLPCGRIHLLTHSLGGLVALTMLSRYPSDRIGRLVLMGTPCAACHCASYLAGKAMLSPLLGRSMESWLDQPRLNLSESVDIGIIAGTHSWGLGRVIPGLPKPNDGVVAVAETRLPQARDTITLPVSHSGMLFSPGCARQVASFLTCGHFFHELA